MILPWIIAGESLGLGLCVKLIIREIQKDRDYEVKIQNLEQEINALNQQLWERDKVQEIQGTVKDELMKGWKAQGSLVGLKQAAPYVLKQVEQIIEPRLALESARVKGEQYDRDIKHLTEQRDSLRQALNIQMRTTEQWKDKYLDLFGRYTAIKEEKDALMLEKAVQNPSKIHPEAGHNAFQVIRNPDKKPDVKPESTFDTAFLTEIDGDTYMSPQKWTEYEYEAGRTFKFKPIMDDEFFTGEVNIVSKRTGRPIHRFHVKDLVPGVQFPVGMGGKILLCGMAKYNGCNKITFATQGTKVGCCKEHAVLFNQCEQEEIMIAQTQ